MPKPIYNLQSNIWDPGDSVIIWLLFVCVCMCVFIILFIYVRCVHTSFILEAYDIKALHVIY